MSESMQKRQNFLSIAEPEQIFACNCEKTEQPGEKIRWKIKKEWKTEEKSDIEIRDLSVTFQDGGEMIHAMEDVSAYFPSGSVTGLIGESGSGKSLLGMSILGLLSGQPGGRKLYV